MKTIRQHFRVSYTYPVVFTHDVFGVRNPTLRRILSRPGQKQSRIFVIIDSGVLSSTPGLPEKIQAYLKSRNGFWEPVPSPYIMKGGEECKRNSDEIEQVAALIDQHHLCRHSFVVAIGGGAVLDAAGFAAATAHRGIRLIRMPTTTLAQHDAGVGVKNGINAFGRKNFLGTFTPPFAVINDFDFLRTLPERHLRAGLAEAVKVAVIKDKQFFHFLEEQKHRLAALDFDVMENTIMRCAELHLSHIARGGDPFEFGSSRPLDFGHWSAHKLEELTDGRLTHGEAVAIGMALDALYSCRAGFINRIELDRILKLLEDIGFSLYHPALRRMDIDRALMDFQEHLGGELTIPLLKEIGEKIEVHEMSAVMVEQGINDLRARKRTGRGPIPDPADPIRIRRPDLNVAIKASRISPPPVPPPSEGEG